MKEIERLKILFDQARSDKPLADLENIEKLVKSGKKVSAGKIKLGKPRRGLFNPLNLLIMISTIAIITSLFIIFSGKPDENNIKEDFGIHIYEYPEVMQEADKETGKSQEQKIVKSENENIESDEIILLSAGIQKTEIEEAVTNKDTIVRGKILHLKKDELERIGFSFDDNGYYYLNELPDGSKINLWSYSESGKGSSIGFGRGGYINPVIKIDPTKRDYYPVCISDLNGKDIRPMRGLPEDFKNKFEYYNDTLVPVILSWSEHGGKKNNNSLAWFRVNRNFYSDLGPSYDKLYENHMEIKNNKGTMVVYDYSYSQLNIGKAIVLDKSWIPNLGFSLNNDSMVYRYGKNVEFWFTSFGSGVQSLGGTVSLDQSEKIDKAMLCAVTNLTIKMSMNVNPRAFYAVDSTTRGNDWIDICIPIRFSEESGQFWEGKTFWYYPNEWLFKNLPDSIGSPMRDEFEINVAPKMRGVKTHVELNIVEVRVDRGSQENDSDPPPCQYFPTFCEGLPGLDDINVFPNPTSDILNVELTTGRAKNVDFRIFDISGRLRIDELEIRKYEDAGIYRHQIDMSSLEEGLYLLVLTDDEGGKMTRRIIRQ